MRQTGSYDVFDGVIDEVITKIEEAVKADGRFDQHLYTRAMSRLFGHIDRKSNDYPGYYLEETASLLAGTKLGSMLPKLLLIRNKLIKLEATFENKYDLGGTDNHVFLLHDNWQSESPIEAEDSLKFDKIFRELHPQYKDYPANDRKKRIIVWGKKLQSRSYFVAMIHRHGKWEIHVRAMTGGVKALKESSFNIENELACESLRYGDCRDKGYIASAKEDSGDRWMVDRVFASGSLLKYTMYDMNSTIDSLL